jgi:hypothetical protein
MLDGAQPDIALLAWAFGAFLVSIVLAGDPRGRRSAPPQPLPGDAVPESWARIARTDIFPSTVGVAVLTGAALIFDPGLAGLLSGILGGMALMTVVSSAQVALAERRLGGVLYVQRGTRQLFVLAPGQ